MSLEEALQSCWSLEEVLVVEVRLGYQVTRLLEVADAARELVGQALGLLDEDHAPAEVLRANVALEVLPVVAHHPAPVRARELGQVDLDRQLQRPAGLRAP